MEISGTLCAHIAWEGLYVTFTILCYGIFWFINAHVFLLWPPCVADADIIFLPCGFFLSIFFIARLISAAADWMSTILPHIVWP